MQIVETTSEGLKRGYTLTITAAAIAAKIEGEVGRLAPQVRMPGFRPGKVPANLIKKMHGAQLHQEALNTALREGVDQLVAEKALRPATQPQLTLAEGYEEGKDAEVTVALEVLPSFPTPTLDGLKLDKLVVPASEAEVDEAVARIATSAKRFEDAKKGHKAAVGDQLIIDFVGSIDGVPFEGGAATDVAAAFDARGCGAIVNNSRGIIFAYKRAPYAERFGPSRWQEAVAAATREMIEQLRAATPAGRL